jgi:uncharacterized membrane protein YtjA (UPF0391 family)
MSSETMRSRKDFALSIALITFACLGFGQTATGQFQGTASLYQYFAIVVILILVSLLPPNRGDNWLRFGRD